MTKTERFIRVLLLAFLIALSLPIQAYTDGEYVTFGNIQYMVSSASQNTLLVVGGTGDSNGLLNIPAAVFDGNDVTFTVTAVGGSKNSIGYKNVTSVKFPETITAIYGGMTFAGCTLSEITIPKSVKSIGIFANMSNRPKFKVETGSNTFYADEDGALYTYDKKTLIMVPSTISGIYYVKEGVENTNYAFYQATKVTKIVWPSTIKYIPAQWPTIDRGCTSLTSYDVASGNAYYQAIDGLLCTKPTSSDPYVHLVKVPWGKSLTGTYKIPDAITALDPYCIVYNLNVDKLDLNNVITIPGDAPIFSGIVKDYHLGAAFKSYSVALMDGTQISKFSVDERNPYFVADNNGVLFNKNKTTLVGYCTASKATSYNIPNTVTTIAGSAFMYAPYLQSIFIPYSVKTIYKYAIRGNNNLSSIIFEDTDEHPAQIETFPGKIGRAHV